MSNEDSHNGQTAYIVFCFLACLAYTVWTIHRFAEKRVTIGPKITVFIAWFTSLSLVYLVPLELQERMLYENPSSSALYHLCSVIYWVSFLLTWFTIPFQQMYYLSGYFTPQQRMRDSLKENFKFYVASGIIMIILIVYVSVLNHVDALSIPALAMGMANLWGLSLSVVLLGYGLVEVPRKIWRAADRSVRLNFLYYKVAMVHSDLGECRDQLDETIAFFSVVKKRSESVFPTEITEMENLLPLEERNKPVQQSAVLNDDYFEKLKQDTITLEILAYIHFRIKQDVFEYGRLQTQFQRSVEKAIVCEELLSNELNISEPPRAAGLTVQFLWYFRIYMLPLLLAFVAGFLALVSVIILWCELTLAFGENATSTLSILYLITKANRGTFGVTIYGFLGFTYMTACAMFALFRLKLWQFYNMHPRQGTDANSLLFNASYTLRLIFPLGFNFLQIFASEFKDQTSYGSFVGQIDKDPVLGTIGRFLPVLIVVLCVATSMNLYGKLLKRLGFTAFDFSADASTVDDQNLTVREGRNYVRRQQRTGSANGREQRLKQISDVYARNKKGPGSRDDGFMKLGSEGSEAELLYEHRLELFEL